MSLGVPLIGNKSVRLQGAELDIDRFDVQTVKLAGVALLALTPFIWSDGIIFSLFFLGLLHDIGHGPFSHMFEHEFLPRVLTGPKWYSIFICTPSFNLISTLSLWIVKRSF